MSPTCVSSFPGSDYKIKNDDIWSIISSFVSRLTIRLLQSIKEPTFREGINHDIVRGLCSEQLMKLSYYIHLGFVRSFRLVWESNLGPFYP